MLLEAQLAFEILRTNPALSYPTAKNYAEWVTEESAVHEVDPWLVHAIVFTESRWTAQAVRRETNHSCSVGLGQINGSCAPKRLQALSDPRENLRAIGARLEELRTGCRKKCDGLGWVRGYNSGSRAFFSNIVTMVKRCHETYAALWRVCPFMHVPGLRREPDHRAGNECGSASG